MQNTCLESLGHFNDLSSPADVFATSSINTSLKVSFPISSSNSSANEAASVSDSLT